MKKSTQKSTQKSTNKTTNRPAKAAGSEKRRTAQTVKEAAKKVSQKAPAKKTQTAPSDSQPRKKAGEKRTAKAKPQRNISFSLDEAIEIASQKKETGGRSSTGNNGAAASKASGNSSKRKVVDDEVQQDNSVHGAASVADILGYNPAGGKRGASESDGIPKKFQRYYKLLVELRDHVVSELDLHTQDTLKRSVKEDSGNLSAYSQHMADAGTDTFDRDFALSLVSSEQEALYEIEEAIQRIKAGSYGICEITGKPIKKERLLAVPFARFSVEGQAEYERNHRRSAQRGGAFAESGEESVQFLDDEVDE